VTEYLAQVALGPVQGFITAAREMRDFAFGSQLLSYLADRTSMHLKAKGAELIFPADTGSVNSNKIMVIFRDYTQDDVQQFMIDVEALVRTELLDMATSFFRGYQPSELDTYDTAIWQVMDVLEYYWTYCEMTNQGYANAVRTLDRLMAARKMTRDFVINRYASDQWKSSLTGSYESVIPKSLYVNEFDSRVTRQQKLSHLHARYGINRAEYLSGIDLFKRRYRIPNITLNYVSPRSMAARSSVAGMNADEFNAFDNLWKNDIDNQGNVSFWDSSSDRQSLLVPDEDDRFDLLDWCTQSAENLEISADFNAEWAEFDAMIRGVPGNQGIPFASSDVKAAVFKESLKLILDDADRSRDFRSLADDISSLLEIHEVTVPDVPRSGRFLTMLRAGKRSATPYYALLKADGDNIGKYVATLAQAGINAHQHFSTLISQFAAAIPRIVQQYKGYCVYVGGDDILAMVPLWYAVECASKLQSEFEQILRDIHTQHPSLPDPSLSIGCVMAHCDEPIDEIMGVLEQTVKYAKKQKSALAVCVAKRSGGQLTVAGRWGQFDQIMTDILGMSRQRHIPYGYAYELRQMLLKLDNPAMPVLDNVIQREAQRILERKKQAENQRVDVVAITRLINRTVDYSGNGSIHSRLNQWVSQVIVAQNLSV
jgi:hypothetical protein